MKLNAKEFLTAVKVLKKVILPSVKTNKPILKAVRITQTKNMLSFAATDIDNAVEIDFATDCEPAAPVLVSYEIVEKTSKAIKKGVESIELSRDGDTIVASVKKLNINWRLDEHLIEEYPIVDFPAKPQMMVANLPGEDVVAAITRVFPAHAKEAQQYSLAGMFLNTSKTAVDFVCTDTWRLHRQRFDRKKGKVYSGIIRESGVTLLKALAAVSGKVKLYSCKDPKYVTMVMTGDSIRMKTMLIDFRYPQYENVIPHDNLLAITGSTKAFIDALQELTPFINRETKVVEFSHDSSGKLLLSVHDANLAVKECKHTGVAMKFNMTYLKDVMRNVEAKELAIKLKQDAEDGNLRIDDNGVIYLVSVSTMEK